MLWVRWSWRDLRARWLQVGAIALVIALGTGTFAGLSSTANWREQSADDSYAALSMFDLRVRTAEGAVVGRGSLLAAAGQVRAAPGIARAEERLILPAQVDASTDKQTILVPGLLVGVDLSDAGPHIAGLHVAEGEGLTASDAGRPVALLEHNFGRHYHLPASGEIRTRGGAAVAYRGHALTPEYFIVTTERGGMLAEANFAAIFTSIETVQGLTGVTGVNDLVLTFEPGADAGAIRGELEAALAATLPGMGVTFVEQHDDPAHRLIYEDIEGDRRTQRVFALLVLAGASAAAFNLITRIVDSQRREIGVAMALGLSPAKIAIRPLLVGAQVALLGVLFGIVVGFAVGRLMAGVVEDFFPLPIWETPFQYGEFGRAAALGFALPFVATVIPVVLAVRVTPVQALQSGYRAARGGGLAPVLRRLPLPGSTLARMPVRNVVRAPRRSLLTGLGIAAAITILVAFAGMIDSFSATVDRGEREVLSKNPARMDIDFAGFVPINGPELAAVASLDGVERVEPTLRLGGFLRGSQEISVRLEVMDLANEVWTPTITRGALDLETPGIYISEVAAADLGVSPGDRLTVVHPRLEAGGLRLVESDLPVLGLHPHPFRFVAYMHSEHAGLMGLAGLANFTWAVPAEGTAVQQLQRELFGLNEVVSAQPAGALITAFRDLLDEFVVIIRIVEGIILVLALLVAFNSASINIDERRREHATMFAFGVPVRRVVAIGIGENFILGLGSTLAGVLAGWLVLRWVVEYLLADTMPDLELATALSAGTYAIAIGLGVLAVAAAPLLTWRKLRHMDIPSTLKFQE
jgi:putative ABC transport system permease protein